MNNAIILLSGGLDSVAAAAYVRKTFDNIIALTFNYGQKAFNAEKKAAEKISKHYNIKNEIIELPWLGEISRSSLNSSGNIPEPDKNELDNKEEMQKTADAVWVPNRNSLFINIAACYAETYGAKSIIIGANKEEAATFKDNGKAFINSVNETLKQSTNIEATVLTPLIDMTKSEIVKLALELNVPFDKIYSCYKDGELHCGKCESCLRLKRALELNNRHDIINVIFTGI